MILTYDYERQKLDNEFSDTVLAFENQEIRNTCEYA